MPTQMTTIDLMCNFRSDLKIKLFGLIIITCCIYLIRWPTELRHDFKTFAENKKFQWEFTELAYIRVEKAR